MTSLDWMADRLAELERDACRRRLRAVKLLPGGRIEMEGRPAVNLSGNDYLGLAEVLEAPAGVGSGATASRLVVGNHAACAELEGAVAALKGSEAALVFGSGYLANVGIIPALVGRDDLVFSDRLNHASIVDGILLSRAKLTRYRHNDLGHLEELLKRAPAKARKLIVTDAIFSMDGDRADLAGIVALKNRHGGMLMVDEAHSGGVFGEGGAGLVHELGLGDQVEVQMGTFSKAYGTYGAYVAGTRLLIEYLVNTCRSLIFTTGLPPVVVRSMLESLRRAAAEPWRRQRVLESSRRFRDGLRQAGLNTGAGDTQIVPVLVGSNARAMAFSQQLLEAGVCGVAIRPPTVPEGTARVRFSLSAAHGDEALDQAVTSILAVYGRLPDQGE